MGELAVALGVPANTVYRIVRTLELGGLVDRSHKPYVSLGLRMMDLGQAKQRHLARELAPFAMPVLEGLTAATDETSLRNGIRMAQAEAGRVFPLYAGASGKVLLPWLSAQLLDSAIAQGDGHMLPNGRRLTAARLRRDVATMKSAGYCVSHAEVDAGASAVAAPVFGRAGQIFAAVSVAGPEVGFTEERLPALIERVLAAAAEIGRHVAARP